MQGSMFFASLSFNACGPGSGMAPLMHTENSRHLDTGHSGHLESCERPLGADLPNQPPCRAFEADSPRSCLPRPKLD